MACYRVTFTFTFTLRLNSHPFAIVPLRATRSIQLNSSNSNWRGVQVSNTATVSFLPQHAVLTRRKLSPT